MWLVASRARSICEAAWRIERAREATGHTDIHEALGEQPPELRAREVWQREVERYRREVERAPAQRHHEAQARELG